MGGPWARAWSPAASGPAGAPVGGASDGLDERVRPPSVRAARRGTNSVSQDRPPDPMTRWTSLGPPTGPPWAVPRTVHRTPTTPTIRVDHPPGPSTGPVDRTHRPRRPSTGPRGPPRTPYDRLTDRPPDRRPRQAGAHRSAARTRCGRTTGARFRRGRRSSGAREAPRPSRRGATALDATCRMPVTCQVALWARSADFPSWSECRGHDPWGNSTCIRVGTATPTPSARTGVAWLAEPISSSSSRGRRHPDTRHRRPPHRACRSAGRT
jgi:hypothetical protein